MHPAPQRRSLQSGLTLIELLIVMGVIGMLAGLSLPNLISAMHRSRQKRTMAELRTLATAVETYSIDQDVYPTASTIAQLRQALLPEYSTSVPERDGWDHEFVVDVVPSNYTVGSGGRDGGSLNLIGGTTTSFDDAIILSAGAFVQWPEGVQR